MCRMIKVFISQPMKDRADGQIKAEREEITKLLKLIYNSDIYVIDSFFEKAPYDAKPLWFLGKSIQLLSDADIIYLAKGWKDSRGCRIEYECAKAYDIYIMDGES